MDSETSASPTVGRDPVAGALLERVGGPEVPPPAPQLTRRVALGLGICAVWAAALWVMMHLRADMSLHTVALFVHLISLVVGFGAVLTVDFQAFMWLVGRRSFGQVTRSGAATHTLIWGGLAGLVASGVVLGADVSSTATRVKLALVLVVALNGVGALALQYRLGRTTGVPSRGLLVWAATAALVSQLGWWGATVIGFMTTQDGVAARAEAPARPAPAGSRGEAQRLLPAPAQPRAAVGIPAERVLRGPAVSAVPCLPSSMGAAGQR